METCTKCGEPVTYIKTVRSRRLKKRWKIFKCEKCGEIFRELR